MPHDHGSSCDHHHHAPGDYGRAFKLGISLNLAFILLEIVYGLQANSVALLADAGHNTSDVIGLFLAWGAVLLAKRKPSSKYTYGLGGSSIIAALGNAVLLLVAVGGIAWESVQRFSDPQPTMGSTVMIVAACGILINGATAFMFMRGRHHDLNIKSAYLHMAADAAISAGVVVAGAVMMFTGWLWLDPVVSLFIALIIVYGTWDLLRDSLSMALHGVPKGIDAGNVRAYLSGLKGVKSVHDLHIWAMSTSETALSAHLLMENGHPGDDFLRGISEDLKHIFHIVHATIQIEIGDSTRECHLAPDHVI